MEIPLADGKWVNQHSYHLETVSTDQLLQLREHIYGNRPFNYNTIPNMAEIRFGVNKLIVKCDFIIKVQ